MRRTNTRRVSVALTALAVGAVMAVSSPLAAQATPESYGTGSWARLDPVKFKIPPNWNCAGSFTVKTSVAQTCIIRSGQYAQPAVIVRNLANQRFSTRARVEIGPRAERGYSNANERGWECRASSLEPRGLSVCYGATTVRKEYQLAYGQWLQGKGFNGTLMVREGPR